MNYLIRYLKTRPALCYMIYQVMKINNSKAYQLVIIAIRAIPSETKYIIIDLVKLPTQLEPTNQPTSQRK